MVLVIIAFVGDYTIRRVENHVKRIYIIAVVLIGIVRPDGIAYLTGNRRIGIVINRVLIPPFPHGVVETMVAFLRDVRVAEDR